MLTQEHQKEGLSRAYVQAVAAVAGINISVGNRSHDYGVDGAFHEVSFVNGKRVDSGFSLEFQLKSSSFLKDAGDSFKYALDADTHHCLVKRASKLRATPAILILLALPELLKDWLELSEENLILRHCCYWVAPTWTPTNNTSSVTIDIPKKQTLTPEVLQELMKKISKGEPLNNDCYQIYSSV